MSYSTCTDNVVGLDQESHRVISELRGEAELPSGNVDEATGDNDTEMVVVDDDGDPAFEDLAGNEAFVCALRDVAGHRSVHYL